MKNIYDLALKWLNSLKNYFSYYNSNTELLLIWTVLYAIVTVLFFLAIKAGILTIFLLLILAVTIVFISSLATVYYLHAIEYQDKKRILPKLHIFANKSWKLRSLFHFIRIPRLSIINNIAKSFKLAS